MSVTNVDTMRRDAMVKDYLSRTVAESVDGGLGCRITDFRTGEQIFFMEFPEIPSLEELEAAVRFVFDREDLPRAFLEATIKQVQTCITHRMTIGGMVK